MSDYIGRQAAIDALDVGAEFLRRALDCTDIVSAEREKYRWGLGLTESYISDIKELPSAQQWIPCSDRPPEEEGHYLVTAKINDCFFNRTTLFVASDDYFSYGWDDFGDSVIAWMPLPEPYRCEKRKLKKRLIMCKDCAYYDCGFCSISNDETGAPKQVFGDDSCDHGKQRADT